MPNSDNEFDTTGDETVVEVEKPSASEILGHLKGDPLIRDIRGCLDIVQKLETKGYVLGSDGAQSIDKCSFSVEDEAEKRVQSLKRLTQNQMCLFVKICKTFAYNAHTVKALNIIDERLVDLENSVFDNETAGTQGLVEMQAGLEKAQNDLSSQLAELKESVESLLPLKDGAQDVLKLAADSLEAKQRADAANASVVALKEEVSTLRVALSNVVTQKDFEEYKKAMEEKLAASPTTTGSTPTQTHGAAKPPQLKTLDPQHFKTFKSQFAHHATAMKWDATFQRHQLMMSLGSDVHAHLTLSVPKIDTMTIDQILEAWDQIICPDSLRSVAVNALSLLAQKLDESHQDYLTRAIQTYLRAHGTSSNPEADEVFILSLARGLRNKKLEEHVKRRLLNTTPKTLTVLRNAINEEESIVALSDGVVPETTISQVRPPPPAPPTSDKATPPSCNICGEGHLTKSCMRRAMKETLESFGLKRGKGQNGGRGRGRGQGRGGGRGNNAGNRGKRKNGGGEGGNDAPSWLKEDEPSSKKVKKEKSNNSNQKNFYENSNQNSNQKNY